MSSAPSPTDPPFRRVTVVGLGVMGGSLARDLSRRPGLFVRGWSPRPEERRAALEAGAVHEAPDDLDEALRDADLAVVAAPLDATCALLAPVGSAAPGAVLTDVASLKAPVLAAARAGGLLERWVGSHPMAGSEESGFGASRAGLYAGARVWQVAAAAASGVAARVASFWREVGADPAPIGAEEHDRLMALASHLPQLASNALARVLDAAGVAPGSLGPGGRDMTRLAASGPAMWRDVLAHAPAELPDALDRMAAGLEELAALVRAGRTGEITALMERTRRWKTRSETEADR